MDKAEAINKVKAYKALIELFFKPDSVYLFGSYARGNHRDNSDIDVAIVINHSEDDYFSVNPLLWKLRRQIDDRIEPILIEKDFDEADFLGEIKKYGIKIA
jgi:uncharacterized protein